MSAFQTDLQRAQVEATAAALREKLGGATQILEDIQATVDTTSPPMKMQKPPPEVARADAMCGRATRR